MSNAKKRIFKKGETVYVVDYWSNSAIQASALIVNVDYEAEKFTADLYGDTYQRYSFKDYNILFFDSKDEAEKAAKRLPDYHQTVYVLMSNRVYKKTIVGISGLHIKGIYELRLHFSKGNSVSVTQIGSTLFLDEASARKMQKANKKK